MDPTASWPRLFASVLSNWVTWYIGHCFAVRGNKRVRVRGHTHSFEVPSFSDKSGAVASKLHHYWLQEWMCNPPEKEEKLAAHGRPYTMHTLFLKVKLCQSSVSNYFRRHAFNKRLKSHLSYFANIRCQVHLYIDVRAICLQFEALIRSWHRR